MYPKYSHVETLGPKVMVLAGEAFRRWLGHEDGAFRNGISALMKGTSETSLALFPQHEDISLEPRRGLHQDLTMLAPWSGTPQPPELGEINAYCLLSHPVCGTLLYTAAWAKTTCNSTRRYLPKRNENTWPHKSAVHELHSHIRCKPEKVVITQMSVNDERVRTNKM